jgi:CheY-like chemotaxis protein
MTPALRILVVDDDEDVRDAMCLVLERAGYVVSLAAHGKEALESLHQHGAPDLILLDLMMPVMDGWELRERLALDPDLARIPMIVLSAGDRLPEDVPILRKPVNLDTVLSTIANVAGAVCLGEAKCPDPTPARGGA